MATRWQPDGNQMAIRTNGNKMAIRWISDGNQMATRWQPDGISRESGEVVLKSYVSLYESGIN